MKIKDVMVKTSQIIYESDLLTSSTFRHLIDDRERAGLVYDHFENFVGIINGFSVMEALLNEKKTVSEITNRNFKILHENDDLSTVQFGQYECNAVANDAEVITGYITKEQYLSAYAKFNRLQLKGFHAIFDSAHNGIMSIDAVGRVTAINPAAEKMANIKKEEAVGKFLTDVVTPSGLLKVVRTGIKHTERYQAGNRTYISNRSPIIENETVIGAVGVFQDVSEIEFISDELRSVKEIVRELETIIEISTEGICVLDVHKKIQKMNTQFKKIFSCESDEVLPKEIDEIVKSVAHSRMEKTVLLQTTQENHSLIATCLPLYSEDGEMEKFIINVRDVTELEKLTTELDQTKNILDNLNERNHTIFRFKSPSMRKVIQLARQVADVDATVFLYGESGVGKESLARKIKNRSSRKNGPFIKVNCGAIPESNIEAELFGIAASSEESNFQEKHGFIDAAHNGVLYLDDIDSLPLNSQVKLLSFLQEGRFSRVGDTASIEVDVRIITSTAKDIDELVSEGKFRKDLYYRLNIIPIEIPPLRVRKEDIPIIIENYIKDFSQKYKREIEFSKEAISAFLEYDWPGNIREIANVLERIFITSTELTIDYKDIAKYVNVMDENSQRALFIQINEIIPLRDAVTEMEREIINKAVEQSNSYRQAASLLDVNVSTVSRKLDQFKKDMN